MTGSGVYFDNSGNASEPRPQIWALSPARLRICPRTQMPERFFRVVQPWGDHPESESTTVSIHTIADEAFLEIERMAERIVSTGADPSAICLLVVDAGGTVIRRSSH